MSNAGSAGVSPPLSQETDMNAPKHPKPDLPIHLQQALLNAACVLRRIKEKQIQKEAEA